MENKNIEDNQNKTIDLTNGIYIPSIECNWLYKAHNDNEDHNYVVDEKYLDKLLNGKIDWSFELMENDILTDNINIIEVKQIVKNNQGKDEEVVTKLYTLDIVNVRYNNRYKTKSEKLTTKRLRDWSYVNGFVFNGNKMTNWKRSGGKARCGENLFILDSICGKCLDWARMDLKFTDKVSIASVRAYESLPLSSAITSINIPNPHESILVIDDYPSEFKLNMSQTWLEDRQLHTESKLTDECNSIWDGQGLLSKKIFNSNELLVGHGNALLRNRLTKVNGISCDLEAYYRDYCETRKDEGLDYDTLQLADIAGRTLYAKNILLVTTPSALKIEKFNKQVLEKEGYSQYKDKAWLYYYLDNCGEKYAVCKLDKPSHYEDGKTNVLSYQMINTIPFSKIQLSQLVKNEIEYVEKLKNDLDFFLQEVKQSKDIMEDFCNDLYYINDNSDYIKMSTSIDVSGAFTTMTKYNTDFANTAVFKEFRRSFIKAYVGELRQGKIRVSGDYCIANGNVVEMLKATTKDFDGTSTLVCNQIYCSRFKQNELVVGFRSPHVNESNIGTHVVVGVPEIIKYFACTPNQVFFNSIKFPTLSTYQGMDFDIDAVLFTNEKCVVDACMNVDKNVTAISVNKIKESNNSNGKQLLTAHNMSDVDHKIAKNYIGDVINLSCEINSKLNHYRYNNINNSKMWDKLFDMSSRCSSISCCEIDKAKKIFESLNVDYEINKIKEDYEEVDGKKVRTFELVDNDNAVSLFFEIVDLVDKIEILQKEINAEHAEKRKPYLKQMRDIRKELKVDKDFINVEILELQIKIAEINEERQDEIIKLKNEKQDKQIQLGKLDTRRIKPAFFKYIGDNKAQKQRRTANRKHREKIDFPIVKQFCLDNEIDIIKEVKDNGKVVYNIPVIKDLKKDNEVLRKKLKANDKIQKEWEEKIYDKFVDTPMNWLELLLDGIKDADPTPTIQVIQLVKKSKKKVDEVKVTEIIEIVKALDTKIKGYKNNEEITAKEKVKKIRQAKEDTCKTIRGMKLNKAVLSGVLIAGLNSVKKSKEVKRKSGIESILLEILFQTYGKGLLALFQSVVKNGGDSQVKN